MLDCLLDWGLCKVRVDGAVQDAPHQTGIHVEVCHDRTLHAVMLVSLYVAVAVFMAIG